MKKPNKNTTRTRRTSTPPKPTTPNRTEMIQSAAMWCDVFIPLVLQLTLDEDSPQNIVHKAREIADLALDEYESRWPTVKLPI